MKRFLKTIALIFIPLFCLAQNGSFYDYHYFSQSRVDSLHNIVENTQNDSLKMVAAHDLGYYYCEAIPDSALHFHIIQNQIAKRLGQKLWLAASLDLLGYTETRRGNFSAALKHFLEAIEITENKDSEKSVWRISKFDPDGVPRRARLTMLANAYNDLGLLYLTLGNLSMVEYWCGKAIIVGKEINDPVVLSYAYDNVGQAFVTQGKSDSAMIYLQKSLYFSKQSGLYKYHAAALNGMGNLFLDKDMPDSAESYFRQGIEMSKSTENPSLEAYSYYFLSNLFAILQSPDSSYYFGLKSLQLFHRHGDPNGQLLALRLITKVLKSQGSLDSAFYYQEMAMNLTDSLMGTEKIKQFEQVNFNQALRLEQLEKSRIETQNRYRILGLSAVLIILLGLGLILYRNDRQKLKANHALSQTLSELKSTQSQLIQSEKMASLGELTAGIAHEIQNPLNFVNNFSDVSSELLTELKEELDKKDIDEAKAISDDVIQNLAKITHHGKRADAIVKGMLAHSSSGKGEKVLTGVNTLAGEYLKLSYHGLRARDKSFNADFKTDFDPNLPKVNVVPQDIGRVLLNLINNAFQAVNERSKNGESDYNPTVIVTSRLTANGQLLIAVKDNGPGIPDAIKDKIFQPFFTTKPTGQGTGLGLSLSYDIVKAHGGELILDSSNQEGTTFTIFLPANV